MHSRILVFARHSFFCTLLLSTSVMAMDSDKEKEIDNLSSKVTQVSLKYPAPPTVTLEEYITNWCMLDGKMDRWGEASGNLASWLRAPENKRRVEDADNETLLDLPLFQDNLIPEIQGDKLTSVRRKNDRNQLIY